MDTELDELGETMTSAEYDQLTQALTDQNVALTDEQGELRNTYDVLQDLSEAWKTMTANEKASLAQMFGSTRNQNWTQFTFIAICSKRNPLNCWKVLKPFVPQRRNEIDPNVMAAKAERNRWMAYG